MRLSRRMSALENSRTLEITERAARMKEEGRDILSLSAGEPDFDTPEPIKDAAVRAIREGRTKYTPSSGIAPLRQAIVQKFKRDNGVTYEPSCVVVSNGAKHSIFNALLAILNEGDEVLIPSPYWVSYPEMVKAAGATPVLVPGDPGRDHKVDAAALKKKATPRTRMLLMNSPCNPTGAVYSESEWREIGAFVVDRDLALLSDEIYEKLIYDGRHVCPAALSPELKDRAVVVNGCSKAFSMTGWRIGYAAGPADVMGVVSRLQSQSTSNPCSISQHAALAAVSGDGKATAEMAAEFRRRRDRIVQRVGGIRGLSLRPPAGAYYAFVDVSATGLASVPFCEGLLEQEGVAAVPGAAFGSDRHVRLSFAVGVDTIDRAAERLGRFAARRVS